jgi:L-ascorbate metabolism protein UlaG (beta-lactamase superfamily)
MSRAAESCVEQFVFPRLECSFILEREDLMKLNGIKITWLGHATFRIETPKNKTILIDPWVMGNPACPANEKEIKKVDVMLCTHGHGDHIGDAVEIA